MSLFLDRIDAVPLQYEQFSFEFEQWLSVMVDSMNEVLKEIEGVSFVGEEVTSTPILATINNTYLISNAAATTVTLPSLCAPGAVVRIVGVGAGGWILAPSAGQTIKVSASSAGTSVASTSRYDCISVMCAVENTTWVTTSSQTAGFTIT